MGGPHLVPVRVYIGVFVALLALTSLTIWVAFHDFGSWNAPMAMGIAVIKGTMVVLFFMHVRYASRLTQVVALSGFLWLLILFAFGMSDYVSRGWLPFPGK
jgi:cytochrome c oxidase subunit IV